MSMSQQVAETATTEATKTGPHPERGRATFEELYTLPGTTRINIPKGAKYVSFTGVDGEKIRMLSFGRPVRGGMVNLHLHITNRRESPNHYRNQSLIVIPTVKKKTFENGEAFLLVDLRLADEQGEGVLHSHKMVIYPNRSDLKKGVFTLPVPLIGAIVFSKISWSKKRPDPVDPAAVTEMARTFGWNIKPRNKKGA